MGKGRKKRNVGEKKFYFAEEQEQAIIDYAHSTSSEERNYIYNTYLEKEFEKMAKSIFGKYHARNRRFDDEERDKIEKSAISHLVEQMVKFDPNRITESGKKAKAYSYCQTIIRNYYKDADKRVYKELIINLPFEDHHEEIETRDEYMYEIDHDEHAELQELMDLTVAKIQERLNTDKTLKKNEIIVGDAIIRLLSDWNCLFLEETEYGKYNKKVSANSTKNKILFYFKELTRLNTKEIRFAMKPFKDLYFVEKSGFYSND